MTIHKVLVLDPLLNDQAATRPENLADGRWNVRSPEAARRGGERRDRQLADTAPRWPSSAVSAASTQSYADYGMIRPHL